MKHGPDHSFSGRKALLIECYGNKMTQQHGRLALHAVVGATEYSFAEPYIFHPPLITQFAAFPHFAIDFGPRADSQPRRNRKATDSYCLSKQGAIGSPGFDCGARRRDASYGRLHWRTTSSRVLLRCCGRFQCALSRRARWSSLHFGRSQSSRSIATAPLVWIFQSVYRNIL